MSVIRQQSSQDDPWLLMQRGPCTTDPSSGEYWRDRPLSPHQMKLIRIAIMAMPPLCSRIYLDCCSYAARRIGSGVLGYLDASSALRFAFGNWKDAAASNSQMPNNYTENKLQLSFAAKYLVAESVRQTISEVGSANFEWGQVSRQLGKTEQLLIQAKDLYKDIVLPHRESAFKKAGLSLNVEAEQILDHTPLGPSVPKEVGLPGKILPAKTESTKASVRDERESSPEPEPSIAESDTSSSSDGEANAAEAEALTDYLTYESTEMVTGASDSSYIHTVDNSKMVRDRVGTGCNARPRRDTAVFGSVSRLRGMNRRFCPKCTSLWPMDIVQKLSE